MSSGPSKMSWTLWVPLLLLPAGGYGGWSSPLAPDALRAPLLARAPPPLCSTPVRTELEVGRVVPKGAKVAKVATRPRKQQRRSPRPRTVVARPAGPLKPLTPLVPAEDATALYERAKLELERHRYSDAIPLLQKLTRLTPENGKVWMKLANVFRRSKNGFEADATLRRGVKACPSNARLRQALADVCRERQRYAEAREHYESAMKLDPRLASVYDSWGRMESSLGNRPVAASLFERGLELRPSARLCHALAVLLDTQGSDEKAREVLRRGLRLPNEEKNPQLRHALAMVEVRAGNTGKARSLLQQVTADHRGFTLAYLSLGQLEEGKGNLQAARRHYKQGATVQSTGKRLGAVQLWQSWARLEASLGQFGSALRVYERASLHYPRDDQLLIGWAKLESEHGDEATARGLLTRAMERPVATPSVFRCAAAVEARAGNSQAARDAFRRGSSLSLRAHDKVRKQMMPLLHAWAVFEWREGELVAARDLFLRAEAASDAPCSWLFQWRARFEADGGSPQLARHYYARAVNAAPLDWSAWKMWSELEAELGHADRAAVLNDHAQATEIAALMESDATAKPLSLRNKG